MSDIVWAINPARDSLLDLTRRMRQHADEIFTLRDIALRFDAPGARDSVRLGVDVRRDLLLIFKEAVNNSARHSGCSRVDIDLRVEGPRLVLSLADNGVRFRYVSRERRPGPDEHEAARAQAERDPRDRIERRGGNNRQAEHPQMIRLCPARSPCVNS